MASSNTRELECYPTASVITQENHYRFTTGVFVTTVLDISGVVSSQTTVAQTLVTAFRASATVIPAELPASSLNVFDRRTVAVYALWRGMRTKTVPHMRSTVMRLRRRCSISCALTQPRSSTYFRSLACQPATRLAVVKRVRV
jgi:hypothetical protein